MTNNSPWGQVKIPKALEKEHKAEVKKKRKLREQAKWYKDFYERYTQYANPKKQMNKDGYTVVHGKEELVDLLSTIMDRSDSTGFESIDIVMEEPFDDEKDNT